MAKADAVLGDIYDAWRAQDIDWLASYLPDDFCHAMHFPAAVHPLAGICRGKKLVLDRWRLYVAKYEFLRFDTSNLLIEKDRAAAQIPLHYRHRETGRELVMTKVNFWTFEAGWPVRLAEYYDVGSLQAYAGATGRGSA